MSENSDTSYIRLGIQNYWKMWTFKFLCLMLTSVKSVRALLQLTELGKQVRVCSNCLHLYKQIKQDQDTDLHVSTLIMLSFNCYHAPFHTFGWDTEISCRQCPGDACRIVKVSRDYKTAQARDCFQETVWTRWSCPTGEKV